jgi:hypothetical protein
MKLYISKKFQLSNTSKESEEKKERDWRITSRSKIKQPLKEEKEGNDQDHRN